jgi:hypothetical protein
MKIIITEEQSEKLNQKVKSMVNKYGVKETLRLFDNNTDIIKRAYQDNPSDFLNQFNDLTPVEKGDKIYYVDKDKLPLFYYYQGIKNGDVYINYYRIWLFFSEIIGMEYKEIQGIMKNWLEETYNLRGLTPDFHLMISTLLVGRGL